MESRCFLVSLVIGHFLLLVVRAARTTSDRTTNNQCLQQFHDCVQRTSGNINDYFRNGQLGDNCACNTATPYTTPTPTMFPGDKTPPTSPLPVYVDGSTCGVNGYMRNGSRPSLIRTSESDALMNAMRNEFPWQALIVRNGAPNTRCSGVIIDPSWVLTTGSCSIVNGRQDVNVFFNVYQYQNTTIQRPPKGVFNQTVIAQKQFLDSNRTMALLKLPKPLSLNSNWTVQSLCLPRLLDSCRWGPCQRTASAIVTGWADSEREAYYGTIKKALISLPSIDEFHAVLNSIDIGAPVMSIARTEGTPNIQRYFLCGFHSGSGYFWPVCDALGWMQFVMQYN